MHIETVRICRSGALGELLVYETETGEKGVIFADQISRSAAIRTSSLMGRTLQACRTGEYTAEGFAVFSARQAEEENWAQLQREFRSGIRNVMEGTLQFVDKNGKFALYQLRQGISGILLCRNYCLNHITSLHDVTVPEKIPVVISSIEEDGRIQLSTAPVFGSFAQALETLELREGMELCGRVTGSISGGTVVMIAPNLSVLVPYGHYGTWVQVKIRSVDTGTRKLKGEVTAMSEGNEPFVCEPLLCEEDLPPFLAPQQFLEENRPCRVEPLPPAPSEPPRIPKSDGSSPLRIFPEETIQFSTQPMRSLAAFRNAREQGEITPQHIFLAETVDTLKYTTLAHLHQFLFWSGQDTFHRARLEKMLNKLVLYGILCRFRYNSVDKEGRSRSSVLVVYTRGPRYSQIAEYRSFFRLIPMNGDDSGTSKGRLAVNQLLLGCLYRHGKSFSWNSNISYAPSATDGRYLNCCYTAQLPELGLCSLESCRAGYEETMYQRLMRYHNRILAGEVPALSVLITLENKEHMHKAAEHIRALSLCFPVYLTYDVCCYEENMFPVHIGESRTNLRPFPHEQIDPHSIKSAKEA